MQEGRGKYPGDEVRCLIQTMVPHMAMSPWEHQMFGYDKRNRSLRLILEFRRVIVRIFVFGNLRSVAPLSDSCFVRRALLPPKTLLLKLQKQHAYPLKQF